MTSLKLLLNCKSCGFHSGVSWVKHSTDFFLRLKVKISRKFEEMALSYIPEYSISLLSYFSGKPEKHPIMNQYGLHLI